MPNSFIVDGRRYDTGTAQYVAIRHLGQPYWVGRNPVQDHDVLYRTAKGTWFAVRHRGPNPECLPLSEDEAREALAGARPADAYARYFVEPEEA